MTAAVMIQGTGSHVGKSVIVAGLCRALVRRGIEVAPFKPQNMSNNAAVAADGGEIGRAQALQAWAARRPPSVHMNPVLLKPETDTGAQVVVQGKRWGTLRAAEYGRRKAELLPKILESFGRVGERADIILVEGAGSPAEVNLRDGDIANMGFAEAANGQVGLLGDIDRGGVIASLVGTREVLSTPDRSRIKGFLINKFRGDARLFDDGASFVAARTGWPCLGVIPWFADAARLPAEDVLGLAASAGGSSPPPIGAGDGLQDRTIGIDPEPQAGNLDSRLRGNERVRRARSTTGPATIAVPALPRIANFDDLDPLRLEPNVTLIVVQPGAAIPAADLVLIPGSKSTLADLAFVRAQRWDIDILAHHRRGGWVLGLCAGYQMLGRTIADPDGIEGHPGTVDGLGLLAVDTVLGGDKTTVAAAGAHIESGEAIRGYEIHLGRTTGTDCDRPVLDLGGRADGARSADGRVAGSYVHGLFAADGFRRAYLAALAAPPSDLRYEVLIEATLDRLAEHLETHVDIDRLLAIAGRG